MKICLVGEYTGNLDEGMRNVASYLAEELSKTHEVLRLDVRNIFRANFWKSINHFRPDLVHYVPGPSVVSLVILKIIAHYSNARTVVSATQPRFSFVLKLIAPKPDLVLTQSSGAEEYFQGLGFRTSFFPNGVDPSRFTPAFEREKERLRDKYKIDSEKFVILHVGSTRRRRNLHLLREIQKDSNQVLIVASTSMPMDQDLYQELTNAGCIVWRKYLPNINEIYQMSDCYVFPAIDPMSSIEIPLSILEAMSCNLPIITTRFGGLVRVFEEGDGMIFVENENDMLVALARIKEGSIGIRTREKVLPYSWKNISKDLEKIYLRILNSK